jgi:hypothetical protein
LLELLGELLEGLLDELALEVKFCVELEDSLGQSYAVEAGVKLEVQAAVPLTILTSSIYPSKSYVKPSSSDLPIYKELAPPLTLLPVKSSADPS